MVLSVLKMPIDNLKRYGGCEIAAFPACGCPRRFGGQRRFSSTWGSALSPPTTSWFIDVRDVVACGLSQVLFKMDHAGMGSEIRSSDLPLTREMVLSDFTVDQFLEMCIMSGCDYLPSVSGVGVKKAHSYISRFKTHSKVRAPASSQRHSASS
jgi:hypothetical protein